MAFLVSPGVQVREVDITNVVSAVATTTGAISGAFEKGPVGTVMTISSEDDLVKVFGKPKSDSNMFETWLSASSFLQYSDNLKVVRAESAIVNAGSNSGVLIRDNDHYLASFADGQGSNGDWTARSAGTWGNGIGIHVCPSQTAYEQALGTNNQVNDSAAAVGDTTITVDDSDASGYTINVGDMISFYSDASAATPVDEFNEYEVTAITGNVLTFRLKDDPNARGLQNAIADNSYILRRWKFYDLFPDQGSSGVSRGPGTTEWAKQNGRGTGDEMHIVVYDDNGNITGYDSDVAGNRTAGVLEIFTSVSKNPNGRDAVGNSNYYPDVIFRQSGYVYWTDHNSQGTNWGTDLGATNRIDLNGTDASSTDAGDSIVLNGTDSSSSDEGSYLVQDGAGSAGAYTAVTSPINSSLQGGTDDYAVTAGELELGYDKFSDGESVDINLVIGGRGGGAGDTSSTQDTHVTMITALCEARKDCVGFVSPYRSATVGVASASATSASATENVVTAFDSCPSSSYMVFDSGYKYMYDKYNDVYRYIPLNGDTAGLCANADSIADPWFSPAGLNRGYIRGAIKLSLNPNKTDRDRLYMARVNPVVNFPGQGVVLFGDKTALAKPSAFDRINVRRLFLVLEKAISTASKFMLFEFNDEFSRAQFRNMVEPFLRDVQGRRGITDFSVVCDGTNNTSDIIDRNEFLGDIYIKPSRAINFITLNFVATRSGVAFSEVGG